MNPTRQMVRMMDRRDLARRPVRAIMVGYKGDVEVEAGAWSVEMPDDLIADLLRVRISVDTAPAGADIIMDIHVNGVTVFTDQTKRPRIVAGQLRGVSGRPDLPRLGPGDIVGIDIDQNGSTTAGANPRVTLCCVEV